VQRLPAPDLWIKCGYAALANGLHSTLAFWAEVNLLMLSQHREMRLGAGPSFLITTGGWTSPRWAQEILRSCSSGAGLLALKRCNRNAGILSWPMNMARESSQQPTRETATGGASRVVLEYGWASRLFRGAWGNIAIALVPAGQPVLEIKISRSSLAVVIFSRRLAHAIRWAVRPPDQQSGKETSGRGERV
jgi:hypothetical protein